MRTSHRKHSREIKTEFRLYSLTRSSPHGEAGGKSHRGRRDAHTHGRPSGNFLKLQRTKLRYGIFNVTIYFSPLSRLYLALRESVPHSFLRPASNLQSNPSLSISFSPSVLISARGPAPHNGGRKGGRKGGSEGERACHAAACFFSERIHHS